MRRCIAVLISLVGLSLVSGCGSHGSSAAGATVPVTNAPAGASTPGLTTAINDVKRVAPALQAYFRTNGYPTTLEEVAKSMPKAKLTMDPSDGLGGYTFNPATKQFVLCVENDSGAWASYESMTGSVDQQGLKYGCPQ
jgi:hypothetical protein